jgi:hypothetical protein
MSRAARPRPNQNQDGTLINVDGTGTGPLANFRNHHTVEQICLGTEAVNMLAQLSAWNVQQVQPQIASPLDVQPGS